MLIAWCHSHNLPPDLSKAALFAISTVCAYEMLMARSLKTSNSGTSTGLVQDGPDCPAKIAQKEIAENDAHS